MSLDQKIAAFLATTDTLPAKSKLVPYTELIRSLRQKRWTYQKIARTLQDEFGLSVASSSIHNFLKVRAKKKDGLVASPPVTSPTPPTATPSGAAIGSKRPRFNLDA